MAVKTAIGVKVWKSNYISLFYIDTITYRCFKIGADLAKL